MPAVNPREPAVNIEPLDQGRRPPSTAQHADVILQVAPFWHSHATPGTYFHDLYTEVGVARDDRCKTVVHGRECRRAASEATRAERPDDRVSRHRRLAGTTDAMLVARQRNGSNAVRLLDPRGEGIRTLEAPDDG